MKALLVLLFISFASLYNCAEPNKYCTDIFNPENKNVCFNATVKEGYYTCCYEYYNVGIATYPSCVQLTKQNFTNLDQFIKDRQSKIHNYQNFTFSCHTSKSDYITISLLSLILLLL